MYLLMMKRQVNGGWVEGICCCMHGGWDKRAGAIEKEAKSLWGSISLACRRSGDAEGSHAAIQGNHVQ